MDEQSQILDLLTVRGRIRVPALREIVAQLSANSGGEALEDTLRIYKLCRLLDMLGHSEYHRGRLGWLTVVSPHLGRLPVAGRELYVLTGARTGAALNEIRSAATSANVRVSISELVQRSTEPLLPCRIALEFESPLESRRLAEVLGVARSHTPPAWTLACFSQEVAEFESSLEWHPKNVSIRGVEIFDPTRMAFIDGLEIPDGPFLCRSISDLSLMFAVNGAEEARIDDADWGRYWALAKASVAAILHDRRRRLIAVPTTVPLPRLLARALCLCSGMAPSILVGERRRGARDYMIFAEVPSEVADKVAQKLGVGFVPQTINTI